MKDLFSKFQKVGFKIKTHSLYKPLQLISITGMFLFVAFFSLNIINYVEIPVEETENTLCETSPFVEEISVQLPENTEILIGKSYLNIKPSNGLPFLKTFTLQQNTSEITHFPSTNLDLPNNHFIKRPPIEQPSLIQFEVVPEAVTRHTILKNNPTSLIAKTLTDYYIVEPFIDKVAAESTCPTEPTQTQASTNAVPMDETPETSDDFLKSVGIIRDENGDLIGDFTLEPSTV